MTVHGRIVLWTLLATTLAGCQSPPPADPLEPPTIRVLSVQMQDVHLDYATLVFEVEIANTSSQLLSVRGMRYGLSSGGNTLFSGTPVSDVAIASETTRVVRLPDVVVCERLLRALNAKLNSTIPFTLELRLFLEAADKRRGQVSGSGRGELFLPPLPQAARVAGVDKPLDVIYIATPQDVVETMLRRAGVTQDDLVYDLGCGDGRVLVTAACKYGCRAVGFDLDPRWVRESRERAAAAGVGDLVRVEQKDIFTVDLRPVDVVFMYLNPVVNRRLIPQLRALRVGARVVSHSFPIGDIVPDETVTMISREDGREHRFYVYTVPFKRE